MEATRKLLTCLFLTLVAGSATAQTQVQRGIARMITRSASDPIVPVQGVEVVVGNIASNKSDKYGRFSMNIAKNREQSYTLADVRLPKGSNLLLASPSKKKKLFLSKNDLEVALITPEDKNTVSKATYRKLLKKYNAQAEQLRLLRTQLEDQRIDFAETSAEYKSLSTRIDSIQALLNQYYDEKNRENTTKEIERIAEELTLTDYQSLEAEDAHIYDLMQEGDWPTLSQYLLKLMNGDAAAYVQEAVDNRNAAKELYNKTSQELAHRLERLQNAIESYKMQCLDDSASYYYTILTKADTTDFMNLFEAGRFEMRFMGTGNIQRLERAEGYINAALRHTDVDTLQAWCHGYLGLLYREQGQYTLAEKQFFKSLNLNETSQNKQRIYLSLSILYEDVQDNSERIKYYEMYVEEMAKELGEFHPYMAASYESLARMYEDCDNEEKAREYYFKSARSLEEELRDKDYFETLYNLGCYAFVGEYEKAKVLYEEETNSRIADRYYSIAITYCERDDTEALKYCRKALETGGTDWHQAEYVQQLIDIILKNKNK